MIVFDFGEFHILNKLLHKVKSPVAASLLPVVIINHKYIPRDEAEQAVFFNQSIRIYLRFEVL
jgi:hypothetical protein